MSPGHARISDASPPWIRPPIVVILFRMKIAVSIPDDVFEDVERLARRSKKSRSQLYTDALREYVARHAPEEVTDAMNRVVDEVGDQANPFVAGAARQALERTEW